MKWFAAPLVLVTLALVGCDQPSTPAAGPAAVAPGIPTRAQGRLQKARLLIGSKEVIAELGATDKKAMGAVMKACQTKAAGRADNRALSALVGKLLP
jgi:hypothetical protein